MAVVKINKLSVQEGKGEELERRFKNNSEKLDEVPGFISFELLRPTSGGTEYFAMTHWQDEESFRNWLANRHVVRDKPVVSASEGILGFEVVDFEAISG